MPDNPEFSLHVHKPKGNARRPALFTIAIWEGAVLLRGICHAQPLDAALGALRKVLEVCGQPMGEVCRHSGME